MLKEILKRFDKEFPNERGVFENGDRYNLRRNAIKQFIQGETTEALNEKEEEWHSYDTIMKIARQEVIEECIEEIIKLRDVVAKHSGTHKYDDCYDDCIRILDKLRTDN